MCDTIYTRNTQHTIKKHMGGNFSNVHKLLKNGQKSDPLAAHYKHNVNPTKSLISLCMCMALKLVEYIYPIGAIKISTEPNYNLLEIVEHILH